MENVAQDAIAQIGSGFGAIWALAITYSFSVIGAVVLMVAGYLAAGLIERAIYVGLGRVPGFDQTLRQFFSTVARYAILAIVLVMVLGQFGVQTASIIAAIGAIGLAIGLALQGTLQNIAAGIMILVLRPFRIGEAIKVGSVDGTVEEVGLFATRLRAADGTFILAPNAKLWNEPVFNTTRNLRRRNEITFAVSYANDLERVRRLLLEAASADRRVKQEPAPIAFVGAMSDVSISMALRYWTADSDFLATRIDLTHRVLRRFAEAGVRLPPTAAVPAEPDDEAEQPPAPPQRTGSEAPRASARR